MKQMINAEASARFITELTVLCNQLAGKGFVIESFRAEYRSFGSWDLEVRNGRSKCLWFSWDGRDRTLSIKGRVPDEQGHLPLRVLEERKFDTSAGGDPMGYVQEYLQSHGDLD